jgi:hypothetical protein
MWELGEHHLAARRYVLARRELEAAEAVAWRDHDAQALARLYLPLLEARRQIRYHAAEGTVLICAPAASTLQEQHLLDEFLTTDAGTILLSCAAEGPKSPHARRGKTGRGGPMACRFAGSVQFEAQRTGRWLEALLLIRRDRPDGGTDVRLASQADPTFAAGLPVRWTTSPTDQIGASTDPDLVVPLPPPGQYGGQGNAPGGGVAAGGDPRLHAVARESLLIAWEALALKWQHRHPPPKASTALGPAAAWEEMAWLRLALRIDPACEPVTMRLIALAEAIQRA